MHLAPDEFMLTMRNKEKKKIASQRVQNLKNKELQGPGYQTTNKSYFSAADEVCLANRRWNVLFVIDTSG